MEKNALAVYVEYISHEKTIYSNVKVWCTMVTMTLNSNAVNVMKSAGVYKVHVSGNPGNRIIMTHWILARKKITLS